MEERIEEGKADKPEEVERENVLLVSNWEKTNDGMGKEINIRKSSGNSGVGGRENQFKKGVIRKDNEQIRIFNNKIKERRITVLRGDEDLSCNSTEEWGEEDDVDKISENTVIAEIDMAVEEEENLVDQIDDFKHSIGEYLHVDDELFDTNIQQEVLVEEERGEESNLEEYRTENENVF